MKPTRRRKTAEYLIFAVTILMMGVIIGCSKVNTDTYDQLKMGMPYDEVIAILGKADRCDGAIGLKHCTWGDDDRYIKVEFGGDRVILFSAKGL